MAVASVRGAGARFGGGGGLLAGELVVKVLMSPPAAHSDSVWSVAWGKNDKHDYIVTGSVDSTVKSWH